MFAVIKTGGKQYSVTAGDIITVMALDGVEGDAVTFATSRAFPVYPFPDVRRPESF